MNTAKKKWAVVSFATLLSIITLFSCNSNTDVSPSANVRDAKQTVDESVGTVSLTIDLGESATEDIIVNYEISGTAILNGDFEVRSGSSITIAKGNSTGTLSLGIFDDQVLESDKSIIVQFSSESLTINNSQSEISITDNEPDISADGLQADLTWDAGTLVDLNLYTAHNVVIGSDNYIESFNLLQESAGDKGFESVFIDNNESDDEYYIVINYNEGSREVNYKLNYNGPTIANAKVEGTLTATDVNYAIFYGPINKSGSSYSRSSGGRMIANQAAFRFYKGKI
jgi:hypothetical protein